MTGPGARLERCYGHDTPEFARVANLSDAVFAIAMTLLVLTLDVGDVGAADLASALTAELPQLGAFALGFALVANIWWQHHKLFAQLDHLEPGLVGVNVALLGAVAFVPFPTSLAGNAPTARPAVLMFIGVFLVLVLLYLWMMERAQRRDAWLHPMPAGLFPWIRRGFVLVAATMLIALLVAVWSPVAGLVVLAASNLPERLLARRAPAAYRRWA